MRGLGMVAVVDMSTRTMALRVIDPVAVVASQVPLFLRIGFRVIKSLGKQTPR